MNSSEPGTLQRLRVFSLSNNLITRIPSYLTRFDDLRIFKADHNPLVWPPKHILEVSPSDQAVLQRKGEAQNMTQNKIEEMIMDKSIQAVKTFMRSSSSGEFSDVTTFVKDSCSKMFR